MAFQRKAPHSHHLESILVHLPADLSTFLAGVSRQVVFVKSGIDVHLQRLTAPECLSESPPLTTFPSLQSLSPFRRPPNCS